MLLLVRLKPMPSSAAFAVVDSTYPAQSGVLVTSTATVP